MMIYFKINFYYLCTPFLVESKVQSKSVRPKEVGKLK